MTNAAFVRQTQEGIRQKLQKFEGFVSTNVTQLLHVAIKAYINNDQHAKQEANESLRKKVHLLTVELKERKTEIVTGWGHRHG